ncbi:DNA-processing protein DprA [Geomonas anaerohicana]|uniref:DNA-processing protein DprA n=1 Tax=Geomonas anaerohicana TaxID=2798583 RepID=A0ABS0YKH3_9BACT|nr:DNA-processing protein DprA [Geomonas anaerohicana]MBJ6752387.1 DNA-processing protein DprA [Geomonas anaerohicana]
MHSIGNEALLDLRKVAFLCSRKFPQEAAEKAYRWADAQRVAGTCVISGYHSPIEKEVLCRLLQGNQPIIIALAQGLNRLDPEWERHLAAGRLLVISRYAQSVSHPCESKCYQRNKMMVDLADTIVIAHVSAGGSLERLCSGCAGKVTVL